MRNGQGQGSFTISRFADDGKIGFGSQAHVQPFAHGWLFRYD